MFKVKIFTTSAQKNIGDAYDRLAAQVSEFMNELAKDPPRAVNEVEWLQSPQNEYEIRLTAIITWAE